MYTCLSNTCVSWRSNLNIYKLITSQFFPHFVSTHFVQPSSPLVPRIENFTLCCFILSPEWPHRAIYWTLGNFSKHLTTINLPKSPTFLGNFSKGVKIFNFSSQIIFGQLLANFYWSHCLSPVSIEWDR